MNKPWRRTPTNFSLYACMCVCVFSLLLFVLVLVVSMYEGENRSYTNEMDARTDVANLTFLQTSTNYSR